MGLPLVKGFVDLMGGRLRVISPWHPDGRQGAMFHFTLTLPDGGSRSISPQRAIAAAVEIPKDWRVLLADDCKVVRISFKYFLKKVEANWTVDEACTGEDAVEMAAADVNKYQLVIMDEYFGEGLMRGTEATSAMKRLKVTATVIGLTADANVPGHKERARESGQDHVLAKPFTSVDKFRGILHRLLFVKGAGATTTASAAGAGGGTA